MERNRTKATKSDQIDAVEKGKKNTKPFLQSQRVLFIRRLYNNDKQHPKMLIECDKYTM